MSREKCDSDDDTGDSAILFRIAEALEALAVPATTPICNVHGCTRSGERVSLAGMTVARLCDVHIRTWDTMDESTNAIAALDRARANLHHYLAKVQGEWMAPSDGDHGMLVNATIANGQALRDLVSAWLSGRLT